MVLSAVLARLVDWDCAHRGQLVRYRFVHCWLDWFWLGRRCCSRLIRLALTCRRQAGRLRHPGFSSSEDEGRRVRKCDRTFQERGFADDDGVAFGFRPDDEIACGIVADNTDLDDEAAMALANHAQAVFDDLKSESAEFRTAVVGRQFRVSIVSGMDQQSRELCRVVDGKLDWRR